MGMELRYGLMALSTPVNGDMERQRVRALFITLMETYSMAFSELTKLTVTVFTSTRTAKDTMVNGLMMFSKV